MNKIGTALLAITSLFVLNAQASIINVAGNDFRDLGTSTIDEQTNLEWLDITATAGRSYCDVYADIQDISPSLDCESSNNDFAASDGWRYATAGDFELLISNFFGVDYQGTHDSPFMGLVEIPFIEQFIALFGDTLANHYSNNPSSGFSTSRNGSGYVRGVLGDVFPYNQDSRLEGEIQDFEVVDSRTGQPLFDYDDKITNTNGYGINYVGDHLGHWLIRDTTFSSTPVPEAPTLALFLVALLSLRMTRNQFK